MKLMAYDENEKLVSVDALYFDGYHIAERQLEGLLIKVELSHFGQDIEITADWPKSTDAAYWIKHATVYAATSDSLSTKVDLSDDGGFISNE